MASVARHISHLFPLRPLAAEQARYSHLTPARRIDTARGARAKIAAALVRLRGRGRRAVSIIDTACGEGGLLIWSAVHARSLGFLAIEASGFDWSALKIEAARRAAEACADPAIGFRFDREKDARLPVDDQGADIVIASANDLRLAELRRIAAPDGFVARRRR